MTTGKKLRDMKLPPGYNACLLLDAADEIDRLIRERDEARAGRDALAKGISAVAALIAESRGVAGLHLNGDEAPWDDLRTGGKYGEWLRDFDVANAQIEQERSEQKGGA